MTSLEDRLHSAEWRQRWEILPGVMTPGVSFIDPVDILNLFGLPADLTGKRCIDIGAWDGALTFEMEKRGGEVLAVDIQDPDATAFNTAHGILDSKVTYRQASVYDLPELYGEEFDVILFRAVYYHLKNPIGAFEAIRRIAAPNAVMCVEGECLRYYGETLDGRVTRALQELADLDIPITLCYPGTYKNGENWFVPNLACFKGWMKATGFEIVEQRVWEDESLDGQRLIATARRTDDGIAVEHTVLQKGWREATDKSTVVIKGQLIDNDRARAMGAQEPTAPSPSMGRAVADS